MKSNRVLYLSILAMVATAAAALLPTATAKQGTLHGGEFSAVEDGENCTQFNGYAACTTLGHVCHSCDENTIEQKKGKGPDVKQGYMLVNKGGCGKSITGKCEMVNSVLKCVSNGSVGGDCVKVPIKAGQ